MRPKLPSSGEIVLIKREASVQFSAPCRLRVISADPSATYPGWAWVEGYELDSSGAAVQRRAVFIQLEGIALAHG